MEESTVDNEFEQAFANVENSSTGNSQEVTEQPASTTGNPVTTGDESPATADAETPNTTEDPQTPKNTDRVNEELRRHQQNHINAQRRINQRNNQVSRLREENERLKSRLAKYEAKQNPNEIESMKIENIREQIEDNEAEYERAVEAANEEHYQMFNYQVAQEVGNEAAQVAIPMIQRWADYVNQNERELVKMSNRPYGKHLLYEWCTRVESSPTALRSWESKTAYEKSRILTELYQQVCNAHTPKRTPAPAKQEVKDVAVADTGRANTSSQPPAFDDFGSAVQQQMQKLGIKKF